MNEQTTQPVALITGASVRLGAGIAQRLHAEGCNLVLHYRHSSTQAKKLADQLQALRPGSVMLVSAFLDQRESINDLIAKVLDNNNQFGGRLDVLVNNASAFYPTPVTEATPEQWDELVSPQLH